MIRVQVTERLIFEAEQLIDDPVNKSSKYWTKGTAEQRSIGALGEIALIDYCWNNDLLAHKNNSFENDVMLFSRHTIEVKTQKVTNAPEIYYRVNFPAKRKKNESSDFLFFTHVQFVAGTAEAVWLLGGCSWDKFWRLSTFHNQGDPMMRHYADGNDIPSGRYFTSDCHDLAISQLAPPSATLKHFKSLQEKEPTQ
jgi:hypothetical protein